MNLLLPVVVCSQVVRGRALLGERSAMRRERSAVAALEKNIRAMKFTRSWLLVHRLKTFFRGHLSSQSNSSMLHTASTPPACQKLGLV